MSILKKLFPGNVEMCAPERRYLDEVASKNPELYQQSISKHEKLKTFAAQPLNKRAAILFNQFCSSAVSALTHMLPHKTPPAVETKSKSNPVIAH